VLIRKWRALPFSLFLPRSPLIISTQSHIYFCVFAFPSPLSLLLSVHPVDVNFLGSAFCRAQNVILWFLTLFSYTDWIQICTIFSNIWNVLEGPETSLSNIPLDQEMDYLEFLSLSLPQPTQCKERYS
jgi:hypothetical protein